MEATAWAQHVHNTLAYEGYDLDSEDYYNELNNRIYKVYPDLRSDNVEQNEDRPAVQRVASAAVGSRQKTQGKEIVTGKLYKFYCLARCNNPQSLDHNLRRPTYCERVGPKQ